MPDNPFQLVEWPRALGAPGCTGSMRAQLQDFRVQELPLVHPEGQGSHLWLEIEKRNSNTDWVARQLAQAAGVAMRDVGFAGMKDRRGVTTQWFSVALQDAPDIDWRNWSWPDIHILQAHLHSRKLRRGTLSGNRFQIKVRELEGNLDELDNRLRSVSALGVPNYFGPQRFGHGGRNVVQGARWLEHGGRLARNKKSIYLSSLRSFLFNQVLSRRVEQGTWNRIVDGDMAVLDGSRSMFACTLPDPETERRCLAFDIHPSGPLPGRGGMKPNGQSALIEQEVLEPYATLIKSLGQAGLKEARRSLRLRPEKMEWKLEARNLLLEFELPPGAYATSVLRELVSPAPVTISEAI